MRRGLAVLAAVLVAAVMIVAAAVAQSGPETIPLPNGYRPEGVAAGLGRSIFVGSIATGRVLEISTLTGTSREVVPAREGHASIGLKYDRGGDRLFVSGGPTGKAFVYDAGTGDELAAFQLTAAGQPTFINDVTLTRRAAYFTDSMQPVIYAVRRNLSGVRPIALTGFPMTPGNNLNGIAAAPGGRVLLAMQSSQGVLWRINARTGAHVAVGLGGATLANGDGLLFVGKRTLLVVQNRLNQIAVVRLDRRYASGRVLRTITHPNFDVPTTVALKRANLYLPNARFSTPPTPETEYSITRVGLGP
jgi:streptogramin lyase